MHLLLILNILSHYIDLAIRSVSENNKNKKDTNRIKDVLSLTLAMMVMHVTPTLGTHLVYQLIFGTRRQLFICL